MDLTGYFDESGHDDKLLIMGGFVSTTEKWDRFSKECDLIKTYFNIPYIHATELFNLKKSKCYGHLSLNSRKEVAGALMSAIIDHTEFSLIISIIPREYNLLTTQQWRSKYGSAYSTCITGIILGLIEHFSLYADTDNTLTFSIYLEDGHKHSAEAEEEIRKYKTFSDDSESTDSKVIRSSPDLNLRIGKYGRLTKEMSPPLWASDLISYCTYNEIARRDAFCADIMQKIHNRVPGFGVLLGREQIEQIIESTKLGEDLNRQWYQDMPGVVRYLYQFGITAHRDQKGIAFDSTHMTSEQQEGLQSDDDKKLEENALRQKETK